MGHLVISMIMTSMMHTVDGCLYVECVCMCCVHVCLKKNQSAPRPSKHPPVMGGEMSKRLGGIKGCKYKTSSWHLNRFPDADNTGSTV